jgi:hypothetical protein
MIQTEK